MIPHIRYVCLLFALCFPFVAMRGKTHKQAYDLDMAKELCSSLPLDMMEGIWIYPDDNVTVLILSDDTSSEISFPTYTISVVKTSDARLHPGDIIGKLYATPEERTYRIDLATEKKNDFLLKPKSVKATLSKEGDALIVTKQKSPLKARLNLYFNRLLPGFWKIVSFGISPQNGLSPATLPVGMIKLYPSYDGNGSQRRKTRYL